LNFGIGRKGNWNRLMLQNRIKTRSQKGRHFRVSYFSLTAKKLEKMGTTQSCRSLPIKEVPRHTWCLFLLSYLTWESFDYLVWRHRWYRLTVQSTTNCIEISLVVVGFRLPHPYLKNSRRYFFWVVDSTLHVISPAAPRSFDIDDTRPKTTSRIIFQSKYFEPIFLVLRCFWR
jgi:hypothetical protein